MSERALDRKGRWRSVTVSFRVSPEENHRIDELVYLSGSTKQDYIIHRVLQKDVVIQGNPRVYKALKSKVEELVEQLRRLSAASEMSEELAEIICITVEIWDGMGKEERTDGAERK